MKYDFSKNDEFLLVEQLTKPDYVAYRSEAAKRDFQFFYLKIAKESDEAVLQNSVYFEGDYYGMIVQLVDDGNKIYKTSTHLLLAEWFKIPNPPEEFISVLLRLTDHYDGIRTAYVTKDTINLEV